MLKFIDLFCGLGGLRLGFESACKSANIECKCVLSSEIKKTAIETYQLNFLDSIIEGDITGINIESMPDFDFLLAGFPCQPFSSAGTRQGFLDTRGTLFFEIEKILSKKKPYGFLLENVDNLEKHDQGKTLKTILLNLEKLGYKVSYQVLNSSKFGLAQERKRIYIVGTIYEKISLTFNHQRKNVYLKDILEKNKPILQSEFVNKLLSKYHVQYLQGKSIKDKRGGENNIHSWDLELKGSLTDNQKDLLNELLKQRRRKEWAEHKGIKWMDGMPLTLDEIVTFYPTEPLFKPHLTREIIQQMLDDMVRKGYLKFEHPKDLIKKNDSKTPTRIYRKDLPKGYNIVTGKLSFEISKILHPNEFTPALVATDMIKLAVVDGEGLRRLTIREGLRLFGFPEEYQIKLPLHESFDLLGNSVPVKVVEKIAERLIASKLSKNVLHNYQKSA